jgi:hypothetical protein
MSNQQKRTGHGTSDSQEAANDHWKREHNHQESEEAPAESDSAHPAVTESVQDSAEPESHYKEPKEDPGGSRQNAHEVVGWFPPSMTRSTAPV